MATELFNIESCLTCPIRLTCGGITDEGEELLSCQFSCGGECRNNSAGECVFACPNNPKHFYRELSEVKAFGYLPQSRIKPPTNVSIPLYVPQIHHGYRRVSRLSIADGFAAVSIADMLEYAPNADSGEELRSRFGLAANTELIAVGVAKDHLLESWWRDFEQASQLLKIARVAAVTVPNFSIFSDAPRHQNLISIARLHHFAEKLSEQGFPTVPHLYAQNAADWGRWKRFLKEQSHIGILAIEFQTGLVQRRQGIGYIEQIIKLQDILERPLHLIAIGGAQYTSFLAKSFDSFTVIDSNPFMKSLYRRGMAVIPPLDLKWVENHTPHGQPVDALLAENVSQYSLRLSARAEAIKPGRMLMAA